MDEALEWAADYVERTKIFEPVRNERGYADGWKIPTPAERAKIITDLAKTVVEPAPLSDIANLCPHGAILCAPCDYIPPSWKAS